MSDINELYNLVKKEKTFDKFKIGVRPYKPILVEKNFRDGFVTRYFAKYIPASNISITEVDESTFKQIKKNPLYQTIEVRWKIIGKLDDYIINNNCVGFGIATENRKNVEYADLTMTGLIRYITNYTEFWQGE